MTEGSLILIQIGLLCFWACCILYLLGGAIWFAHKRNKNNRALTSERLDEWGE